MMLYGKDLFIDHRLFSNFHVSTIWRNDLDKWKFTFERVPLTNLISACLHLLQRFIQFLTAWNGVRIEDQETDWTFFSASLYY